MEMLLSVIVFQGHCFIAVNPKVYADGFEDRMQASMDQYRNLEPVGTGATDDFKSYEMKTQPNANRLIRKQINSQTNK